MGKKDRRAIIIPGPRRCGTTTLFKIVNRLPVVESPKIKEPCFFLLDQETIEKNFSWYMDLYSNDRKYLLDGSTLYFSSIRVFKNIKKYLDEVKILIILRDPVKRAYSSFWLMKSMVPTKEKRNFKKIISNLNGPQFDKIKESENKNIYQAIEENKIDSDYLNEDFLKEKHRAPFKANFEDPLWPYKYFQESIYSRRIKKIRNLFDNIKILFLEELIEKPNQIINEIYDFINPSSEINNFNLPHTNKSSLPNNWLAQKIEKNRRKNRLFRKMISSSEIINRTLTLIYNSINPILFQQKPTISYEDYSKGRNILNNEYEYWFSKNENLKNLWKY